MTNGLSAAVPSFGSEFCVRRASPQDAQGIVTVVSCIASERVFSAIDRPWPIEQQRRYLESLSERETFHIAVDTSGAVIGFQTLDLWSPSLGSMAHVGQLGTFLLAEWRRRGVGRALFQATASFARSAAYRKFVIQVRASNRGARGFYERLGFIECGRLTRQVVIDGQEDDEILMEVFL